MIVLVMSDGRHSRRCVVVLTPLLWKGQTLLGGIVVTHYIVTVIVGIVPSLWCWCLMLIMFILLLLIHYSCGIYIPSLFRPHSFGDSVFDLDAEWRNLLLLLTVDIRSVVLLLCRDDLFLRPDLLKLYSKFEQT